MGDRRKLAIAGSFLLLALFVIAVAFTLFVWLAAAGAVVVICFIRAAAASVAHIVIAHNPRGLVYSTPLA